MRRARFGGEGQKRKKKGRAMEMGKKGEGKISLPIPRR